MLKRRKWLILIACACCIIFSITALAMTRDSKGWNVYNSSRTVYANVGVTFVSDSFSDKANVSYTARVLGEDAEYITINNKARIQITGNSSGSVDKYFYYGSPISGTQKISSNNTYVNVRVTIDNAVGNTTVNLD